MSKEVRVNDRIAANRVILIDSEGNNRGIVGKREAIVVAQDVGLDLIQVSASDNGQPPICKIMDYGKYRYKQSKKTKAKHEIVKEIRVSYRIAEHDLAIKHKKVRQFIAKHYKVKYVMVLRGREQRIFDEVKRRFEDMVEEFEDIATWQPLSAYGNRISVVLNPKS